MAVRNTFLFWGTPVQTQLDKETAPDKNELKKMDEILLNPTHGFYSTSSGEKLHYLKYLPQGRAKPKAICVLQHGIGSFCGRGCKLSEERYTGTALLARMLTKNDFALYAPDLLGHGFAEGRRFYIPQGNWSINRDNLESFSTFVSSEHEEGTPLFIMGESYGGCLAIHVARMWQNNPEKAPSGFRGICLISPAIIGDLPPQIVVFILRYFFATIAPRWRPFFMPNPVNPERIWKDDQVKALNTSERSISMGLHHGGQKFRLGTAIGLLSAMEDVRQNSIPGLTIPFAVAHGTDDAAVPIEGTEYLLDKAETPKKDRAFNRVVGGYHDIMSERNADKTVQFLIDWMCSRLYQK